jgi:hypothetical protein
MKIPCWDQIQAVLSPGLYLPTSGGWPDNHAGGGL